MAKVYRVLDVGEERTLCKFVLVNKMQCWQYGTQEITEVVRGPGNQPLTQIYQFCERHVKIQQAIDTGNLPATESGGPQHRDAGEDARHILGVKLANEVAEALSGKQPQNENEVRPATVQEREIGEEKLLQTQPGA